MQLTTKLQTVLVLGIILLLSLMQSGLAATPAEVYRKAVPAVVLLVSMEPNSKTRSKGTGSMITNRHVLTNAHVVLGDSGRPMDKTLVLLAEHLGHGRIVSTDERDFQTYRWKQHHPFTKLLLP